jgi:hypothetical protein
MPDAAAIEAELIACKAECDRLLSERAGDEHVIATLTQQLARLDALAKTVDSLPNLGRGFWESVFHAYDEEAPGEGRSDKAHPSRAPRHVERPIHRRAGEPSGIHPHQGSPDEAGEARTRTYGHIAYEAGSSWLNQTHDRADLPNGGFASWEELQPSDRDYYEEIARAVAVAVYEHHVGPTK